MKWWFFCLGVVSLAFASNAKANDKVSDNNSAQPAVLSQKHVSGESVDGGPKVVHQDPEKKNNENATFVDRDGDGINDGKEYRFRSDKKKVKKRNRRYLMKKRNQSKTSRGR